MHWGLEHMGCPYVFIALYEYPVTVSNDWLNVYVLEVLVCLLSKILHTPIMATPPIMELVFPFKERILGGGLRLEDIRYKYFAFCNTAQFL